MGGLDSVAAGSMRVVLISAIRHSRVQHLRANCGLSSGVRVSDNGWQALAQSSHLTVVGRSSNLFFGRGEANGSTIDKHIYTLLCSISNFLTLVSRSKNAAASSVTLCSASVSRFAIAQRLRSFEAIIATIVLACTVAAAASSDLSRTSHPL